MKKLVIVFSAILMSAGIRAQQDTMKIAQDTVKQEDLFCAKKKNGKIAVVSNGKRISEEVTLADGSRLSATGTLVKSDGKEVNLKEGQCVSREGKISEIVESKKVRKTGK